MGKKKKEEAVDLLREQIKVKKRIIDLYEKAAQAVQSKPVRHLLHTIEFDSMKHIDICSTVLEILQGEDVLQEEKRISEKNWLSMRNWRKAR